MRYETDKVCPICGKVNLVYCVPYDFAVYECPACKAVYDEDDFLEEKENFTSENLDELEREIKNNIDGEEE